MIPIIPGRTHVPTHPRRGQRVEKLPPSLLFRTSWTPSHLSTLERESLTHDWPTLEDLVWLSVNIDDPGILPYILGAIEQKKEEINDAT